MYSLTARDKHAVLCMASGQAGAEIMHDVSPTLNCDHEQPIAAISFTERGRKDGRNLEYMKDVSYALTCPGEGGRTNSRQICDCNYRARRLTPLECERLQGYPDGWTDIPPYITAAGKQKTVSDAARYKALGNSISIPNWKWVLKRITAFFYRDATLGSLFDGIGGFPYIWEQLNGRGSARWASEIEDFPIAVTKYHFGEK